MFRVLLWLRRLGRTKAVLGPSPIRVRARNGPATVRTARAGGREDRATVRARRGAASVRARPPTPT
jgi:hypothetical protein